MRCFLLTLLQYSAPHSIEKTILVWFSGKKRYRTVIRLLVWFVFFAFQTDCSAPCESSKGTHYIFTLVLHFVLLPQPASHFSLNCYLSPFFHHSWHFLPYMLTRWPLMVKSLKKTSAREAFPFVNKQSNAPGWKSCGMKGKNCHPEAAKKMEKK